MCGKGGKDDFLKEKKKIRGGKRPDVVKMINLNFWNARVGRGGVFFFLF